MFRITVKGLDANSLRRQLEEAQRRAIAEAKRAVERNVGGLVCPLHRERPQKLSGFSNEIRFRFCCDVLRRMAQAHL